MPASWQLLSTTTGRRYQSRFGVYLQWIETRTSGSTYSPSVSIPFLLDLRALIDPSIDGGSSGLPALYILDEILSRLAFDLNLDQELLPWRHFELIIGTGPGG